MFPLDSLHASDSNNADPIDALAVICRSAESSTQSFRCLRERKLISTTEFSSSRPAAGPHPRDRNSTQRNEARNVRMNAFSDSPQPTRYNQQKPYNEMLMRRDASKAAICL
jgi:hypothetical protein